MQLPANRGCRGTDPGPAVQMDLEQRDCPLDGLITEVVRALPQTGSQDRLEFLGPERRSISSTMVGQTGRVPVLVLTIDPVIHTHPACPHQVSDLRNGSPVGRFQYCQGAPEEAGILGRSQLLFESATLGRRQLELAHGTPRLSESTSNEPQC